MVHFIVIATAFGVSYTISENKSGVGWGIASFISGVLAGFLMSIAGAAAMIWFTDGSVTDEAALLIDSSLLVSIIVAPIGLWFGISSRLKKQAKA